MKILPVLLYSLFGVGFILKFFHIHYNAVIMLVALGGLLVTGLISLGKKPTRLHALFQLGAFSWLALLLITVKFFPFGIFGLILASCLSVMVAVLLIKGRQFKKLAFIGWIAGVTLLFYLMPTDSRYYLFNVKWNHEIEYDFMTLDKYSWFLYRNGNNDKALEVSARALDLAKNTGQTEWVDFIEEHREAIRNLNWERY